MFWFCCCWGWPCCWYGKYPRALIAASPRPLLGEPGPGAGAGAGERGDAQPAALGSADPPTGRGGGKIPCNFFGLEGGAAIGAAAGPEAVMGAGAGAAAKTGAGKDRGDCIPTLTGEPGARGAPGPPSQRPDENCSADLRSGDVRGERGEAGLGLVTCAIGPALAATGECTCAGAAGDAGTGAGAEAGAPVDPLDSNIGLG